MLTLRLADVALWTKGSLHGADVEVHGVFTDTRAPQPGGLFVALAGEHYDAHEFVAAAKQAGAAAALVARPVAVDLPQVVTIDTTLALGDLASAIRAQRRARVVGITGSNGKTTVKTLVASILALHGRTHVNAGNFNNEIGLPLSIARHARGCRLRGTRNGCRQAGRHRLSGRHRAARNRPRQQHCAGPS